MSLTRGTALYKKESVELVKKAIGNGYTYFDGAQQYGNSESIGIALKETGTKRDDVFLLTKCEWSMSSSSRIIAVKKK